MNRFKFYLLTVLLGLFSFSFYSCEEEEEKTEQSTNESTPENKPTKGGDLVGEWYYLAKSSKSTIGGEDFMSAISTLYPELDLSKAMNILGEKLTFKDNGSVIIYDKEGSYATNNGDLSISASLDDGGTITIKEGADFTSIIKANIPEGADMIQSAKILDFSYFADKDSMILYLQAEVIAKLSDKTFMLPANAVLMYVNYPVNNDSVVEKPEGTDQEEEVEKPENPNGGETDTPQIPEESNGFLALSGVYEGMFAETEPLDVTIEANEDNTLKLALYGASVQGISIGDLVFDGIPAVENGDTYAFTLNGQEVSLYDGMLKAIVDVEGEVTTSGDLNFTVKIQNPDMEIAYKGTKKK